MGKASALFILVIVGISSMPPALACSPNCGGSGGGGSGYGGGSGGSGGGRGGGGSGGGGGGNGGRGGNGGNGGGGGGGGGGGNNGRCPLNALKLGACVDVLSGLVHVGLGDPAVNQCCPLIQGVLALEAALCLCTTIRIKLLNLNIILPLALELFIQCGVTPPPGFTCPPLN